MARRQPDIRKPAARQRRVIWLVAAGLIAQMMPFFKFSTLPATGVVDLLFIAVAVSACRVSGILLFQS